MTESTSAALSRLRDYLPPPTEYYSLPQTRRAAVLVLLCTDKRGELRVVLTMRAKTLSSYAGEAALPGGKAESLFELPYETARREAYEEIGLPLQATSFGLPFRISHLCQLPISIAPTWLGVRPCVAWIEADQSPAIDATHTSATEEFLPLKLDANEVTATFTVPLKCFLRTSLPSHMALQQPSHIQPWYKGDRFPFNNGTVRMYNFYVPTALSSVKWSSGVSDANQAENMTFRIFGLTAKILVETARIAFNQNPQFEHDARIGDEDLIRDYIREGKMGDKPSSGARRQGRKQTHHDEIEKKANANL